MKKLTDEDIKRINDSGVFDSWDQGIFKQPLGVEHIKERVVYQRHKRGGHRGGIVGEEWQHLMKIMNQENLGKH